MKALRKTAPGDPVLVLDDVPEPVLTRTVPLDEAPRAIEDLRRGVGLKVLVSP